MKRIAPPDRYNFSFMAASLRPELGRTVAEIYLAEGDWSAAKRRILETNALQCRSASSSIRMERELRQRLVTLTRAELTILATATADDRAAIAWLAVIKHTRFAYELAVEVLRDKLESLDAPIAGQPRWMPSSARFPRIRSSAWRPCCRAGSGPWTRRPDGRTLMRDHEVVFIFHNRIDKIGDSASTEANTFDAVEAAFEDLERIIKKVANINGSNMLLTADHGFLFQQDAVGDGDMTPLPPASEWTSRSRRFALGRDIVSTSAVKVFASAALGVGGDWDCICFDEFAGKDKRVDKALVDIMKNYMANRTFSRGIEAASVDKLGDTTLLVPEEIRDLLDHRVSLGVQPPTDN